MASFLLAERELILEKTNPQHTLRTYQKVAEKCYWQLDCLIQKIVADCIDDTKKERLTAIFSEINSILLPNIPELQSALSISKEEITQQKSILSNRKPLSKNEQYQTLEAELKHFLEERFRAHTHLAAYNVCQKRLDEANRFIFTAKINAATETRNSMIAFLTEKEVIDSEDNDFSISRKLTRRADETKTDIQLFFGRLPAELEKPLKNKLFQLANAYGYTDSHALKSELCRPCINRGMSNETLKRNADGKEVREPSTRQRQRL